MLIKRLARNTVDHKARVSRKSRRGFILRQRREGRCSEAAHVLPTWGTARFLYAKGSYEKCRDLWGYIVPPEEGVVVAIRHEEGSSSLCQLTSHGNLGKSFHSL